MLANKQLREYMHTVFNLETQMRTLTTAISRNNAYASSLGHAKTYCKPTKFTVANVLSDIRSDEYSGALPLGLVAGIVFSFVLGMFCEAYKWGLLHTIFAGAACISWIIFIFGAINVIRVVSNLKKYCENSEIEYQQNIIADARRVEEERKKWMAVNEDTKILYDQRRKVKSALDQYYNLGIIYSKYRDILPVSMFVQYLDSGRATRLEGSDGCYNIFEYEVRQDIIIDKLDTVIEKLDDLSASVTNAQYELTNALNASNRQIQRLCSKTDDANRHLAAIEYQNQITANNTRVLAEYSIYRDLLR